MTKLKVAFCMRGAVGKDLINFIYKDELYKDGQYIDYKKCYNSIVKHIFEPNRELYDIDVFQHCWNIDLENDLVSLYKPKAYLFEDNRKYHREIEEACCKDDDFSGISQALAIKKSIEVKEEYEKKIGIQYDIVMLYRYDVLLWKDILFPSYTNLENRMYVNGDINADFHFVMNNAMSSEFKYLYYSIPTNPHLVHFWINNYVVNYMEKELVVDDIEPGKYQEVIRKIYKFSIEPGHLSFEKFCSYS